MAQKSSTLKPPVTLTPGPGIITTDDGMGGTMISATTVVNTIDVGPGLVKTQCGNGDVWIDVADNPIQPTTRIESKPIFMIGLPSSTPDDSLQESLERMENKMPDYHVLMLKNITDVYTAKMFKETGTDTLSIDEIKKYIDQKTR